MMGGGQSDNKTTVKGEAESIVPSDESFEILGIRGPEYTLKVYSPRIVHSPEGNYTTYCIMLQTTSSAFRLSKSKTTRRFSDFLWLRKELKKVDHWRSPPQLNARRVWNLLDLKFIAERRHQLEQWTHEVLSDDAYLSNTALHLFLQTEMPVKDIIDYLEGRYPADKVEQIWQNQGKLYNYQAHNLLHNSFRQEPVTINFCPTEVIDAADSTATDRTSQLPAHDGNNSSSPHYKVLDNPAELHRLPPRPAQSSTSSEYQSIDRQRSISPSLACGQNVASMLDHLEREASPDSGFFPQELGDSTSSCAVTTVSFSPSSSSLSSPFSSSRLTTERTTTTNSSSSGNEGKEETSSLLTTPAVSASSSSSTMLQKKTSTPKADVPHLPSAGHSYTIN